ncbi:MAG: TonB-dependent receptor [Bdellovibrio sp.]|nr:TonB-dependent receptor [Bdellovibrio sp.]
MGNYIQILSAKQKAMQINQDDSIYGAFAEIGAGQEVARHFFQAGGAARTIAKTISAYDMAMSDAIYGKEESGRYVCEGRLSKMLDREFSILLTRLVGTRPANTRFFAFANTVATRGHASPGYGVMGLRFQHRPGGPHSDVILHVRMLDNQATLQQESLGFIGVNLLYGCYFLLDNLDIFLQSLLDNLTVERISIETIKVLGPAFQGIDSRLLNFGLIKRNFSPGIIFDENGQVHRPGDALYNKNVIVLRGSFRPPTLLNLDMIEKGLAAFKRDLPDSEQKHILCLCEISMHELLKRGAVDDSDFLARVDLLAALGQKVLISNHETLWSLNNYLEPMCKKKVAYILSVYSVEAFLDVDKHLGHPQGPLAAIGQTLGQKGRIYVYPIEDEKTGQLITVKNCRVSEKVRGLLSYLLEMGAFVDIENYNKDYLKIWSRTVLKMIENGEPGLETMLPPVVIKIMKEKKLFGFH